MHSLFRHFVLLMIICTGFSKARGCGPALLGEGPSLTDVLQQVDVALRPPLQCRMRISSLESKFSQKQLPDGTLATRTEAVYPSQAVVISHGDAHFEVLPLSRIVIDKTQIRIDEYLKGRLRGNENSVCFQPQIPPGFDIASQEMVRCTPVETIRQVDSSNELRVLPCVGAVRPAHGTDGCHLCVRPEHRADPATPFSDTIARR